MIKFCLFLEKLSKKIIEILAILLFAIITLAGAFQSAYLEDGYGLKLFFVKDSLLLNLLFGAILLGIIKILADYVAKNMEKRRRILLALVLTYTFVLSLGWAAVSKHAPTADQASVYYASKHFAADYFEAITENGSYFSCYPHQMGLALFYELIFRIFHTESFHVLQGVNAVCNCITVFSLYQITTILFEEKRVSVYYLLLMILCFPLFWYTPFIYGELPSFAFGFFGVWMLLAGIKCRKDGQKKSAEILYFFAGLVALLCATLVRKNTLILIIAVALTLGVYAIKERKYTYLVYIILLCILSGRINAFAADLYEKRSGGQLGSGVPGIAHVVMGLQESEYAPGWYNGFNFNIYTVEAKYNQEEAVRLSKIALDERLSKFQEEPVYTLTFFRDKFMAEWLNTGYACYDSTASKYYERSFLVESLYTGNGFFIARFFMDKYQFLIYLFALLFVVGNSLGNKRKQENANESLLIKAHYQDTILCYIFPITVIGGALFYLVWEGSGRYILPYFIMTIPYAAAGMSWIEKTVLALPAFKNRKSIV